MIDTILINGLWQGALVVAIAGLLNAFIPARHAATRYAVWFAALVALALLPVVSLWHTAPAFAPMPNPVTNTAAVTSQVTATAATAGGNRLVFAWAAGVVLCLLRLALSYVRIARIVRRAKAAPEFGADVMTSADVPFPIAARIASPVVIVPEHLPATLDRNDLESIIRHERAHIVRMDTIGNFVQRTVEAFLFFNPWVYVIGRQLVQEREAACDDWAVYPTGESNRYASCLAQLAQGAQRAHAPLLTPSAIGSRRMLVGRIARLLNGKAAQLKVNYLVLGASVIAFGFLAVLLQTSNGLASIGTTVVAATSSCTFPHGYSDVKVLNAAMPDIPKSAYRPNLSANVLVTVGPDGRATNAKIVKSSGSAGVDRAAVTAATHSTYTPKMKACKPMTGQYLFHVDTGV